MSSRFKKKHNTNHPIGPIPRRIILKISSKLVYGLIAKVNRAGMITSKIANIFLTPKLVIISKNKG